MHRSRFVWLVLLAWTVMTLFSAYVTYMWFQDSRALSPGRFEKAVFAHFLQLTLIMASVLVLAPWQNFLMSLIASVPCTIVMFNGLLTGVLRSEISGFAMTTFYASQLLLGLALLIAMFRPNAPSPAPSENADGGLEEYTAVSSLPPSGKASVLCGRPFKILSVVLMLIGGYLLAKQPFGLKILGSVLAVSALLIWQASTWIHVLRVGLGAATVFAVMILLSSGYPILFFLLPLLPFSLRLLLESWLF